MVLGLVLFEVVRYMIERYDFGIDETNCDEGGIWIIESVKSKREQK